MIEHITGRQVKLVPPSAYFVSAPAPRHPERPAVEVAVATDITARRRPSAGPLIVDVSAVMDEGEPDRMILATGAEGQLALFAGVNLEL